MFFEKSNGLGISLTSLVQIFCDFILNSDAFSFQACDCFSELRQVFFVRDEQFVHDFYRSVRLNGSTG